MQDLTAYKKYKEKAVASAARSLITLFREIAPYMLEKKDRGRGADLEARPMQYGAGQVRVGPLALSMPSFFSLATSDKFPGVPTLCVVIYRFLKTKKSVFRLKFCMYGSRCRT